MQQQEGKGRRADYMATNELQTPFGHKSRDSKHLGSAKEPISKEQVKQFLEEKKANGGGMPVPIRQMGRKPRPYLPPKVST